VFFLVYLFESVIKLLAYGFRGYFTEQWNQFDFLLIITSVLDVTIDIYNQFFATISDGYQITKIFRVLRLLRLFKLFRSIQGV